MPVRSIENLDVKNKIVLYRVDLNVPMKHGKVVDDTRIEKIVPTIKYLQKKQAKIVVISHFGRPKHGFERELSLAPITNFLSQALDDEPIKFAIDCIGNSAKEAVANLQPGEILLLENLRFHEGEEKNDPEFISQLASLADFYVNDTFSCSHRAHASIIGVAEKLPSAAGLLLKSEIDNLEAILKDPAKPIATIVGGSKVSTKLTLLESLIKKVDILVIGGAMANTFLKAKGYEIGKSLYEESLVKTAKEILKHCENNGCEIILPIDVVTADELVNNPECQITKIENVSKKQMILDFGPETIEHIANKLKSAKTIAWNGPIGAFEFSPFDVGTITLARYIARFTKESDVKTIAGGGDVIASLNRAGVTDSLTYICTGGGAFLEWLEGKELPGIKTIKS